MYIHKIIGIMAFSLFSIVILSLICLGVEPSKDLENRVAAFQDACRLDDLRQAAKLGYDLYESLSDGQIDILERSPDRTTAVLAAWKRCITDKTHAIDPASRFIGFLNGKCNIATSFDWNAELLAYVQKRPRVQELLVIGNPDSTYPTQALSLLGRDWFTLPDTQIAVELNTSKINVTRHGNSIKIPKELLESFPKVKRCIVICEVREKDVFFVAVSDMGRSFDLERLDDVGRRIWKKRVWSNQLQNRITFTGALILYAFTSMRRYYFNWRDGRWFFCRRV